MKRIIKFTAAALIIFIIPICILAVIGSGTADGIEDNESALTSCEPEGQDATVGGDTSAGDTVYKTYIVSKTDGLNVRAGSSVASRSLGTLDAGDMVVLVEKEDNWYKTLYRGGTAYVTANAAYTELYKTEISDETVEAVISVGEKYLGTPYVYGAVRLHDGYGNLLSGFTDTAFDCSSLMQFMFYYGADINLQVNTRTQVAQGVKVERGDLKRGDLIFFTNSSRYYNTGLERIGHVAIYLGDNYILQTASDHAVIEEISATRWSYYIEARRMING